MDFFSDLICCFIALYVWVFTTQPQFFTCEMELSLSLSWATLLDSVAVLSLLYPSLLWHTYTHSKWLEDPEAGADGARVETDITYSCVLSAYPPHSTIWCWWCWWGAVDNDPGIHLAWLSPCSRRRPTRGELSWAFDLEQKPMRGMQLTQGSGGSDVALCVPSKPSIQVRVQRRKSASAAEFPPQFWYPCQVCSLHPTSHPWLRGFLFPVSQSVWTSRWPGESDSKRLRSVGGQARQWEGLLEGRAVGEDGPWWYPGLGIQRTVPWVGVGAAAGLYFPVTKGNIWFQVLESH